MLFCCCCCSGLPAYLLGSMWCIYYIFLLTIWGNGTWHEIIRWHNCSLLGFISQMGKKTLISLETLNTSERIVENNDQLKSYSSFVVVVVVVEKILSFCVCFLSHNMYGVHIWNFKIILCNKNNIETIKLRPLIF